MVVVLTSEQEEVDELMLIHRLFEAGLKLLHIRKPAMSFKQHCLYLQQISPEHHPKIVVHYCHELIEEFSLKGVHLTSVKRKEMGSTISDYMLMLRASGKSISSSFHEVKEIDDCTFKFDYHFLSPLYTSISKQGYKGRGFDVNTIPKKVIGLGGIQKEKIPEILALGYSGIACIGAVWNSKNPVESFIELNCVFRENLERNNK